MAFAHQAFTAGQSGFERSHGGSRRQIWDADEGGAAPADLAMPGTGVGMSHTSARDFHDLVRASLDLVTTPPEVLRKRRHAEHMSRVEREALADAILGMGKGQESRTFQDVIYRKLAAAGVEIPMVEVEYDGVTMEANALVGDAGIPTLANTARGFLRTLLFKGGHKTKPVKILADVTGVLKPGRTTLLMGPPGAGKTVFLKMLAGRFKPSADLRISGSVKYNGCTSNEFVVERTVGLVDQYDTHLPVLTVRETLQFSRTCQQKAEQEFSAIEEVRKLQQTGSKVHTAANGTSGAAVTDLPDLTPEEEARCEELAAELKDPAVRVEYIIKILGLQRCADTVVGNAMVRGVSGGEKKRVTTGEILVGGARVLLMDEISTGLDSATTFTVIKWLRVVTHAMRLTTVVSLLQPAPEVFALFDDVLLLTDGRVIYHGPVGGALPFFEALGFVCPMRKDPGSFLQEVTTAKGQMTFATDKLLAMKGIDRAKADAPWAQTELLVSLDDICAAFWETKDGRAMRDQLDNHPVDKSKGHPGALQRHRYALPLVKSVLVVTKRQITLMMRDGALTRGRFMQVIFMSLVIGTLFWHSDISLQGSRNFFGVMFFSIMFLAMGSMPQMALTLQNKSVFYKQRDAKFFPPTAWAAAMSVTQIPWALVECTLFTLVVYFFVGFYRSAGNFFTFYLLCLTAILCLSALFRMLACICTTMVMAQSIGAFTLLALVISSGFAIVRGSIPGWWIWAYWISPFAYLLRSIVINEMTSPHWDIPYAPGISLGQKAMSTFDFQTSKYWIWVGVAYCLGLFVIFTCASAAALRFINPPHAQPVLPEELATDVLRRRTRRTLSMSSARVAPEASVSKSNGKLRPVEEAVTETGGEAEAESSLPFTPITLVCQDLRYFVPLPAGAAEKGKESSVPGKLELLKGLTLTCEPGVLTALMGGSGAGKTTLMDVIAGRKTQGAITGNILVNGHPKDQATWSRVMGYVEQTDIHSPTVTVYESLIFSARLRLPVGQSDEKVREHVEEVMAIVELDKIRGSIVGYPGQSGLSVEQRKRLSIGVEMVANPSVIFMDEPTSGLDARAAVIVMQAVKNVSRNGRTVMVTIHQPSIEIFETFDAMVLLQAGGRMTYCGRLGEESSELIAYLQAVPGVSPIQPGANPATWMLEVTGGSAATTASAADADFPALYKESQLARDNADTAARLAKELPLQHEALTQSSRYATSMGLQFRTLFGKFFIMYWRSPSYNATRFVMTVLIALLYGTMYWNKGRLPAAANVQNVMGVLFSSTSFQGMFNLMTAMPFVSYERTVFYRERAASMYSSFPYSSALALVEIPYILAQTTVFVPIAYWMIRFRGTAAAFFFFYLVFFMVLTLFTFFGQFLVYVSPSIQMAQIMASGLNALWQLMNGFIIAYSQMPAYWKWLNRITPTTWILYALASNQLGDVNTPITDYSGNLTTVAGFLRSEFEYKHNFEWFAVLIVGCFILFFRGGGAAAIKLINYQKR